MAGQAASMTIRAAVIERRSGAFVLDDLQLEHPRPDEVLVRIVATGICQTDLHIRDQHYPVPHPVVAGHEGAGVVERVGDDVRTITPGDHVVLSYPYCGHCRNCLTAHYAYCEHGFVLSFGGARQDGTSGLSRNGKPLHGHIFQQSSFATYALATERNTVKVPVDAPLELLGPLGCGFQTGAGAVLNALRVTAESSIAIFGTGSVGLAAVMAARIAGASPIIAVDVNPGRLALAAELGATHTINGRSEDVASRIAEITDHGADYVLEITARPEMLTLALEVLGLKGTAALIGGARSGTRAAIDMNTLLSGRTLRGIVQGDAVEKLFIPKLVELHQAGRLPFDRLVTFYDFGDINQAVADMQDGKVIKPVLRMSEP
jgi:aryl-alcohol dehydrogenase